MVPLTKIVNKNVLIVPLEERLGVESLAALNMNFKGDNIGEYDEMMVAHTGLGSYKYVSKNIDLDFKIGQSHYLSHLFRNLLSWISNLLIISSLSLLSRK